MKKLIKRLCAISLSIAILLCNAVPAYASESSMVTLTDDLVIEMAERFATSVNPDANLEATNPIKFYDESGQAIGYIVDYYENDIYSGYVVFDSTQEGIISEYTFDPNSKNPYQAVVDSNDTINMAARNAGNEKLYKLSSFTYGILDYETSTYHTNYGEEITVESSTSTNASRSSGTTTWDAVLLDIAEVYENYNYVSSNNLPEFIAISEDTIEQETGRYACSVTAMYACAMYYGAYDYSNIVSDYVELWSRSSTSTIETKNGIIYGSTTRSNVGPAFQNYCASRGLYVTYSFYSTPTFSSFKTCIDNNNIAIVHCAINVLEDGTSTRSGHSMTVEGYTTLQGKTTGNTIRTLMVFDGWNEYVRYLNFDSEDFTELESTVFTYY